MALSTAFLPSSAEAIAAVYAAVSPAEAAAPAARYALPVCRSAATSVVFWLEREPRPSMRVAVLS